MNYINIGSGLGNQMFQYAFYLGLKSKGINAKPIIINKNTGHYGYELNNVFNINNPFKGWSLLLNLPHVRGIVHRLFDKTHTKYPVQHYIYEPELMSRTYKNMFFDGFWQTEKYFLHSEFLVRETFKFHSDKMNSETLDKANIILQHNSVSVHIRRGDYQSEYFKNTLGKCCTGDYYKRALDYCCDYIENPLFVFFSDDMDWVKEHLKIDNAIYITHNKGEDSWQDMYLMSICHHNIIANSSFSWWGAWLNENKNKIVIAPEYWWADCKCEDVVPSTWLRL